MYNADSRGFTNEFQTDLDFPRITSLACSPVDPIVVSSALPAGKQAAGSLVAWNLRSMKSDVAFNLEPTFGPINTTRFNHNGKLLVTGESTGVVRIFDMSTMSSIMEWPAHQSEVVSVQFSFDETSVFSLAADGELRQWSLHRYGEQVTESLQLSNFPGESRVSVAFDSEVHHILTTTGKSHAVVHELKTGDPVRFLSGHSQPVTCVDWSQVGNTCLTGSEDRSIRISKLIRV